MTKLLVLVLSFSAPAFASKPMGAKPTIKLAENSHADCAEVVSDCYNKHSKPGKPGQGLNFAAYKACVEDKGCTIPSNKDDAE